MVNGTGGTESTTGLGHSTGKETEGFLWVQQLRNTACLLWVAYIEPSTDQEIVGLLRVDGSSNGSVCSTGENAGLLWIN